MALAAANAVTVVTDSTANQTDATPSGSFTVTAGTQAIIVGVTLEETNDITAASVNTGTVTAMTYNGVAMTFLVGQTRSSLKVRSELWGLANPASGSHTLAATFDALTDAYVLDAVEITGAVNLQSPFGATGTAEGSSSTQSVSVTTTVPNSLVVAINSMFGGDTAPFSPTAGTELLDHATGVSTTDDAGVWFANRLTTTAGATTISCTSAVSDGFSIIGVEIKPASYLTKRRGGIPYAGRTRGIIRGKMTTW